MHRLLAPLHVALVCLWAIAPNANAGPISGAMTAESVSESSYHRGAWDFQAMAGPFLDLELGLYDHQPAFDYELESLRIGYILINPAGSGLWHGNFELLLETLGGEFFRGPADYLVGGDLLLRWNFIQVSHPRWVPYLQLGGGGLYHDAQSVDTRAQTILGSNVEAMLHAGSGMRYYLNEKWSIDSELGYRHISNAGTTEHNRGLNSLGGQIGLGYLF
jgi:Lipid A 3-O-deacylase (PagL)